MITCLAAHPAHPVVMFGMDDGKLKLAQVESGERPVESPRAMASRTGCRPAWWLSRLGPPPPRLIEGSLGGVA